MARHLPLPHLILALLVCLPTLAAAQPAADADPIAADVSEAEQSFRLAVAIEQQELTNQIKAVLEREIQQAIAAGDLDSLESLQDQLTAYQTAGTTPDAPATRSHFQRYQKSLTRLGDELVRTYESATRRYTQARDIDNARLMQTKMKWTRPTIDLDTKERAGHVYLIVRKNISWHDAKAECEALGGYLACLNEKSEHRFIVETVMERKGNNAWVGATDAHQEGDWVWLDGNDDGYWPWNKGEPNNGGRVPDNYAAIGTRGGMMDLHQMNTKRTTGYICEWDHTPTRENIYQTEESKKQEAEAIEVLQIATLKHNELIVSERKRLQSAILAAEDEATITQAKTVYNSRVVLTKRGYIEKLQGVLKTTLEEDRLNLASTIKTQILRVQRQLDQLSIETPDPNVPALDEGGVETTPDQPPAEDPNDNPSPQDPADAQPQTPDDTGKFFGLPLE